MVKRYIKVNKELLDKVQIFLKNTFKGITKEDVNEAISIYNELIITIKNQYEKLGEEFTQIKKEIENSELSEWTKNNKISKEWLSFRGSIVQDEMVNYYVQKLGDFINNNSICDFCKDAVSLIQVYCKIDGFYNEETLKEIHNTRDNLCDKSRYCGMPNCIAEKLIYFLDNDNSIKKRKKVKIK